MRHGRARAGRQHDHAAARAPELPDARTRRYRRKLQELILARAASSALYTKPQILELYLNKVYFGDGLYGVEAASRGYFGKHALRADGGGSGAARRAGEVAVELRADGQPGARDRAPQRRAAGDARERRDRSRRRGSRRAPARSALHDSLRAEEPHGQYFKEQVRQELVERFGWQRVYQGGLRVYSTIDMPMQQAAETAVADQLEVDRSAARAWQARRAAARQKAGKAPAADPSDPLQAALVALDPDTGHVRAMVGGRDFDESHFNRAVQAQRQPGSAFKPFVYAAALEAGYHAGDGASITSTIRSRRCRARGRRKTSTPTRRSMSLRTGLRTSSNRAAVRLLQEVGIPQTVQYAKTMGVGDVPSVPSLALGSGEVTLQSMTAAYAAFANHGLVPTADADPPRRRSRRPRAVSVAAKTSTRAISETTAFLMSTMLADVINAGTGDRARALGFTLPAAGKTGTTNDFNDAWFVGFTPKLVAGVWVGFDQPQHDSARTASPPTSPCRCGRSS